MKVDKLGCFLVSVVIPNVLLAFLVADSRHSGRFCFPQVPNVLSSSLAYELLMPV